MASSSSSPSNSAGKTGSPTIRQNQKRPSFLNGRLTHKNLNYLRVAVLVAVIILVLGYARLASAAYWLPPQLEGTADQSTQFDERYPEPHYRATVAPAADELSAPENVPDSTLFSSPESPNVVEPIATPAPAPANRPLTSTLSTEQNIEHVVIISIDGMRPDGMEQADTPTMDRLKALGAYSPNAQTINPSFTLPAHVSMLNGVVPQKHGIVEALPCIGCRLTIGPTVFSAAHDAGYSTGMIFGKEKLNYLALENSVDALFGIDAHDPEVTKEAVEIIEAGLPNVLFIHLPDTDRVGHEYGWMSQNYLYAINYADGMVDKIVTALNNEGYFNKTLLIILADHGGHNFEHGLDCPEDMTIPWLAVGPGVPQGSILSSHIDIYDTAATALYALDVPIPEHWDGRPVLEIFQ